MTKKYALIFAIIGVLLISTLAVTIEAAAAARPHIIQDLSNRLTQASWIRINGNIEQWGTTDVRGQLQTQARAAEHESSGSKQQTGATAIWTTNTTRAIQSVRAKENFTYVFYEARLPNASITAANTAVVNGYTLSGNWSIATILSTTTVITDENGTITKVHRDQDITRKQADGTLTIADNKFTLTIDGMDALTGPVHRTVTRSWFNPFKMNDDASNNAVTHTDVKTIASCYGNMPGWGQFDQNMDFNHNYRVDIADIATVASNVEQ